MLPLNSIVTFKYTKPGYRTTYFSEHVNTLFRMIRRHYRRPFRAICVTDDPAGIDASIETLPMWSDHFHMVNPTHPTDRPNCYPRLKLFAPEAEATFGKRFMWVDLDMLITGDLHPVFDRPEDFVIYDPKGDTIYNGSMVMMTAGAREKVWTQFDPVKSPRLTTAAGFRGSDQAWIRYILGPGEARWTPHDRIFDYQTHIWIRPGRSSARRPVVVPNRGQPRREQMPTGARIIAFCGGNKPWSKDVHARAPWVRDHYLA